MGSSPALRARAVMSQGCRSSHPTWLQKAVQLLRELLPNLGRLAILYHIGNPVTALQTDAVKSAAGRFGLDVAIAEVRRAEDIAPAIEALKDRAEALDCSE